MKRVMNAREVATIRHDRLPWMGKWAEAFGNPSVNETWFISGQSASGKSSFVMQLARELTNYGSVLYLSLEEGFRPSFQDRLKFFDMGAVSGRMKIATDQEIDILRDRLRKPRSPKFVIVDSFQIADWTYAETNALIEEFPRKGFIFVSQEFKGSPMGKAAVRLRYLAGIKIRTIGYRAMCQGRFSPEAGSYYTIWEEGAIRAWLNE